MASYCCCQNGFTLSYIIGRQAEARLPLVPGGHLRIISFYWEFFIWLVAASDIHSSVLAFLQTTTPGRRRARRLLSFFCQVEEEWIQVIFDTGIVLWQANNNNNIEPQQVDMNNEACWSGHLGGDDVNENSFSEGIKHVTHTTFSNFRRIFSTIQEVNRVGL